MWKVMEHPVLSIVKYHFYFRLRGKRKSTANSRHERKIIERSWSRRTRSGAWGERDCMREQPKLHLEFYQRMSLMERCHPENFLLMWCQRAFGRWLKVAQKLENVVQPFNGWVSTHLHGGRCVMAGLLIEVGQSGAHTPIWTAIECDGYSERKLSSFRSTQHVYVRDEWAVVCRVFVHDNGQNWMRNVDRGVRKERALRIPRALKHSQFRALVLPDLTTKSAKECWLNRRCSAGFMMSRMIFSSLSWSERVKRDWSDLRMSLIAQWLTVSLSLISNKKLTQGAYCCACVLPLESSPSAHETGCIRFCSLCFQSLWGIRPIISVFLSCV